MNTPYTYLLYCKSTKQYYYGVRYAKNCNPKDFWTSYFTSSAYVSKLIKEYGKSDFIFEIRKTFKSPAQARRWEEKVLRRIKVSTREDFINKSNSVCPSGQDRIWINDGNQSKFINIKEMDQYKNWNLGRVFNSEHKSKISQTKKRQGLVFKPTHTKEQKEKWSEQRKGRINGRNTSKPFVLNGIYFSSIKEAMVKLNLSRDKIKKLANL